MESLILAAVMAALKAGASEVVKDAYTVFKSGFKTLLPGKDNVLQALDKLETNPGSVDQKSIFKKELDNANIYESESLKLIIDTLLTSVKESGNDNREAISFVNEAQELIVGLQVGGDNYAPVNLTINSPEKKTLNP